MPDVLAAPDGARLLRGAESAAQRLADALRIQRGSYPLLRDYGSRVGLALDRRPAEIFAAVADAIAHPPNGLSDVTLRAVRVAPARTGQVIVEVDAGWAPAVPAGAPVAITVREQLTP